MLTHSYTPIESKCHKECRIAMHQQRETTLYMRLGLTLHGTNRRACGLCWGLA
jgi:hypothetical protein